jgi:hypothetical protein
MPKTLIEVGLSRPLNEWHIGESIYDSKPWSRWVLFEVNGILGGMFNDIRWKININYNNPCQDGLFKVYYRLRSIY